MPSILVSLVLADPQHSPRADGETEAQRGDVGRAQILSQPDPGRHPSTILHLANADSDRVLSCRLASHLNLWASVFPSEKWEDQIQQSSCGRTAVGYRL